jgi:hypothetical protein
MIPIDNPYASPPEIAEPLHALSANDQAEMLRRQILSTLKTPALGIVISSCLGIAIFAWTLGTIFYARLDIFRGPDGPVGSPDYSDLHYSIGLFVFQLFIAFPLSFFGSIHMPCGKHRQLAVAACILCLIPGASPGFPFSLLFAFMAFSRLRRPEVASAFDGLRVGRLANRHMRLEQLVWPASVLLFLTTLLSILLALPWIAALWLHYQNEPGLLKFQLAMTARPFGWLWPLLSYSSTLVIFASSIQMMRGKSYTFCLAGATLAMIPLLTPCFIVGIPFGIWASVILWNKDTRAAFSETSK